MRALELTGSCRLIRWLASNWNFSGVITYDRLVELAGEIKSISEEDIMRAFKTFDLNGDKFISLTELRVLLQKVCFYHFYESIIIHKIFIKSLPFH